MKLAAFMRLKVNTPFSELSFLLFHLQDANGTDDDDTSASDGAGELSDDREAAMLTTIPTSSQHLLDATEGLVAWSYMPGYSTQAKQVFHEYATAIRDDVTQFNAAVMTQNYDEARAGFEKIQRKCDACHHFFRYEEPVGDSRSLHSSGPSQKSD